MIDVKVLASSSGGNCYHISDGSTPLLIDCGLRYQRIQQGIGFGISRLGGCLVTHEHKDHSRSVQQLMKAGIDCYMTAGTAEMLKVRGHRLHIVKARVQFRIGAWTILPFETQHDAREPIGFLLGNEAGDKLLYATDTYYLRYRFKGLTHLMIECNYSSELLRRNVDAGLVDAIVARRVIKSHFSLEHLLEFLTANDLSQVECIWLLHLSDNNSDESYFKTKVMEATGKPVVVAQA